MDIENVIMAISDAVPDADEDGNPFGESGVFELGAAEVTFWYVEVPSEEVRKLEGHHTEFVVNIMDDNAQNFELSFSVILVENPPYKEFVVPFFKEWSTPDKAFAHVSKDGGPFLIKNFGRGKKRYFKKTWYCEFVMYNLTGDINLLEPELFKAVLSGKIEYNNKLRYINV
jgi:hypothetical protein